MPKQSRIYPDLPQPLGAYAHAVRAGPFLFIAGMTARGSPAEEAGMREQAEEVFGRLKRVVEAEGASLDDIVKTSIYVTDIEKRAEVNEVRDRYFQEGFPASTLVQVSRLVGPKLLIEVDAIALLP